MNGATPADRVFAAGLAAAAGMARDAATLIDARPDRDSLRQRAAAEALRGFAEGIGALLPASTVEGSSNSDANPSPVRQALAVIADIPGASGEIECPKCAGRLRWTRAESNGHVWGSCETAECVAWMM